VNRVITFATLALAACFNPTFNNPTCGPNGECPSGTTCVQNVCRSEGADIDAPVDTSPGDPDAMSDADIDAPGDGGTDGPIDAAVDAPDGGTVGVCPNGIMEGAEQCDDNNTNNNDDCTAQCRLNVCGDGFQDSQGARTDVCDDGNNNNNDNCVAITISGQVNCRVSICGDGYLDMVSPGVEECDDAGGVGGDGCSTGCQVESGYQCTGQPSVCGPFCGDGVIVFPETCDDGNDESCGTCFHCDAVIPPRAATGTINGMVGSNYIDGDFFFLNDGINAIGTAFEFDLNGNGVMSGRVAVPITASMGQGQVATATINAINSVGSGLLITAGSPNQGMFTLTHDRLSANGNQMIVETVINNGFTVTGMSGGAAGDCPSGTGCIANNVCTSGTCTGSLCQ
jgi:cysteine-rich repeat protein